MVVWQCTDKDQVNTRHGIGEGYTSVIVSD